MSQKKLACVIFLFVGMVFLETKKIVLVPLMRLDGRHDLPPPCAKQKICLLSRFPKLIFQGRIGEFGGRIWLLCTF